MKIERIHLGSEIKKVVGNERGNQSNFAKNIGIDRTNLKKQVFEKKSLDTEMIACILALSMLSFFTTSSPIFLYNSKKL